MAKSKRNDRGVKALYIKAAGQSQTRLCPVVTISLVDGHGGVGQETLMYQTGCPYPVAEEIGVWFRSLGVPVFWFSENGQAAAGPSDLKPLTKRADTLFEE